MGDVTPDSERPNRSLPSNVKVNFGGAVVLRHRSSPYAIHVQREPVDLPMTISNVTALDRTFPLPLPGRHWLRRFYLALAWSLGRKGRSL